MPEVNIRETEPFDVALRRFKRACEKAGILAKLRQVEFYEKPTSKRKRKHAAAIKRWEKKLFKEKEGMMYSRSDRKKPSTSRNSRDTRSRRTSSEHDDRR